MAKFHMNERKTFTYMNRNNILLQKKSKVISTNKKKIIEINTFFQMRTLGMDSLRVKFMHSISFNLKLLP